MNLFVSEFLLYDRLNTLGLPLGVLDCRTNRLAQLAHSTLANIQRLVALALVQVSTEDSQRAGTPA